MPCYKREKGVNINIKNTWSYYIVVIMFAVLIFSVEPNKFMAKFFYKNSIICAED